MAGTSYYVSHCKDCISMNLNDRWALDPSKAYCSERKQYFDPNDRACSNRFQNDESRNPSSTGCYLTTIVCEVLGFEDSCRELDTLRSFRENVMKRDEKYHTLLCEYDAVGPLIAEQIRNSLKPKDFCQFLYQSYIVDVVSAVEEGKSDLAVMIYSYMVGKLKNLFGLEEITYDPQLEPTGKGYFKGSDFQNQR